VIILLVVAIGILFNYIFVFVYIFSTYIIVFNMTYSYDLRDKISKCIQSGKLNIKQISELFNISKSCIYYWKSNHTPIVTTRKTKITSQIKSFIVDHVCHNPNFCYKNLIELIMTNFNTSIGKSKLYNILAKSRIKKKKVYKMSCMMNEERRQKLTTELKTNLGIMDEESLSNIEDNSIISIDECSFDTYLSHNLSWSPRGKKTTNIQKQQKIRYTAIYAASNTKIINVEFIKGSCNGEFYKKFIQKIVKSTNSNQKRKLLMDNARIHHYKKLKSFMKRIKKCKIVYNVPYSPEYNPVERVFSKTKNLLRKEVLTKENLIYKIKEAFAKVTSTDLTNFFTKSLSKLNH